MSELTAAEKCVIGCFVVFHVVSLLSAVIIVILSSSLPSAPEWAFSTGFLLFIIAAGLYVPLMIMLAGVADEQLPVGEKDRWIGRFRREPWALVEFWWKYLR